MACAHADFIPAALTYTGTWSFCSPPSCGRSALAEAAVRAVSLAWDGQSGWQFGLWKPLELRVAVGDHPQVGAAWSQHCTAWPGLWPWTFVELFHQFKWLGGMMSGRSASNALPRNLSVVTCSAALEWRLRGPGFVG